MDVREPVSIRIPDDHDRSLLAFAQDLRANGIETLLVLDANPAFGAPGHGAALADGLRRVGWSACASRSQDETAEACRWRLPLSHPLESWGDLPRHGRHGRQSASRSMRPLHESRTAAQILAMLAGAAAPDGHALVRRDLVRPGRRAGLRRLLDARPGRRPGRRLGACRRSPSPPPPRRRGPRLRRILVRGCA